MSEIVTRKADHIRICLEENVQCQQITNGFNNYRFTHSCLPELNYTEIDITTQFLGKNLKAPLLISSMTGGTKQAKIINFRLAEIAEKHHLAMGVGSQRIALENPEVIDTFNVRKIAPNILLFANLGAVQLNYNCTVTDCLKIIDHLQADALILHLNPLQECIQNKGDKNFKGLLTKIADLCHHLPIPVIVKEVGNGINAKMAQKLINAGVTALDVAGAGGTSWAKVESERAENLLQRQLGETFADWGIPTADCIKDIRQHFPDIPLIASGGLRNGLDITKAIALGADIAGLAYPFLQAATKSSQSLDHLVQLLIAEITTVLFCTGNPNLISLKQSGSLKYIP